MKVGDLKRLCKSDLSKHYAIVRDYIDSHKDDMTIDENLSLIVASERYSR